MNIPIHQHENTYYVAFRIERILMVHALGEYAKLYDEAPEYQSTIAILQHTELLSSLLQSGDERFTYEVRMTSSPNVDLPNRGHIDVYCIVAMRCDDITEAHEYALGIYRLFNAHFRDVIWRVVHDVSMLLGEDETRHAISLTRKNGFIMRDRNTSDTTYGLIPTPASLAQSQRPNQQRMFFISAFVASGRQVHAVFDYLLQHPVPVTISMRIQRTQLTAAEMRFYQDNLDSFSDASKYPAAVAHQLMQYQSIMNGIMLRSFALAALFNIDVVSSLPIPEQLITLIGNLITQPAGGVNVAESAHKLDYSGGYDVIHQSDYLPVIQAIRAVRMRPIPASRTPEIDRLIHIVDVNEAAAVLHIPRSSLIPIPGMQMQSHRQLRPPSDLSDTGTVIGQYAEHGITKPIHISETDRTRHTYVIGQTGTGKSTVIKSMVLDDIVKGRGVCVIDPHGDLVNDIMAQIPEARIDDVIVIDPTHTDASVGLNLFEYDTQEEREMAIQLFQKIVELVERARGTSMRYMGPQFMQHLRNNAYWVTQDQQDPGTIIEMYNMYAIKGYYKRWLPINEQDIKLKSWQIKMERESYHVRGDGGSTNFSYFSSKFEDFVFDSRIRAIFGQKHSTFNFYDAMNTRKIILINLSRGLLSEIASAFMGGVIMAKLQQAALKRALLPAQQRTVFSIYVDEFQNYTSESFVSLLSESRKYGIALTLANQFLTQIKNERIVEAILGNVGTIISFRVGLHDGKALQPRFAPEVTPSDLINLPNWQAYVSTQVNGQSRRPFSMQTIRPREELNQQTAARVLVHSKQQYGRPRSVIEGILSQSMLPTRTVARKETISTSNITLTTHPIIHETISSSASATQSIAIHGCGLSLWQNINEEHPSHTLMHIGLHAQLHQRILDVPLIELVPMQQRLGAARTEFSSWMNEHRVHTLRDAMTLVRYQQSINEHAPHVVNYCHALIAYQMHQSRPEQSWHTVALTNVLAAALDVQQRAWVWGTSPTQIAHVIDGVCALVGCEFQLFLLKTDGTVWRVSRDSITAIPDVHGITHLSGGQNFVAAIDAHGHVHLIYEHEAFAQRIGATPPHTAVQLVAAGFDHVIAYDAAQQFVSWGNNDYGCGVIPSELTASSVPVVALAAGIDSSFALDAQGRLYAWGHHKLTQTTLQTLNAHKVHSIACYGKDFICRTSDGTWWHNNQALTIPSSLATHSVTQIVGNYTGSWLAMRAPDAIPTWIALMNQEMNDIAGLDPAIIQAARTAGINTIYDVCMQTHAQLVEHAYFAANPTHLDALIASIHALCTALQLPTSWPVHTYTVSELAPSQHHYGWYVKHLTPHRTVAQQRADDDNDVDKLYEDIMRDMDD